MESKNHHIVSALVENKSGVLARIAGLFARRGFNIYSLAVAPTNDPNLSRVTIVVDVEASLLSQVVNQLDKLINVVEIQELKPTDAVERELLLATVECSLSKRTEVIQIVTALGGEIVDVNLSGLTIEMSSSPDKLDALEELLSSYGIIKLQRTGRVALPRLTKESDTYTNQLKLA
jgi:acetolactate synthase-1/3 small subunit